MVFSDKYTMEILLKFLDKKCREAEKQIEEEAELSDANAIPLILKTQFNHIAHLEEELTLLRETMDKRFEKVDQRFEQMLVYTDNKFKEILEYTNKRFEQVDKRFEQVDKRFEQVDKRFEQVDKRFEQIDKRLEQVDQRFERIDNKLEYLEIMIGRTFTLIIGGFTVISVLMGIFKFIK